MKSASAPASGVDFRALAKIGGWLSLADALAISALLSLQRDLGVTGDLLEIGAYEGRSAVIAGTHVGPRETLHICDPFERFADDPEYGYTGLMRATFEKNFREWHGWLPEVHQTLSSDLETRLGDSLGKFRFVHVDGSHLYPFVRADIVLARRLLGTGGIIVLDDYRQMHTPGVAAATWESVGDGLHPLLLSPGKFYGSWDPDPSFVGKVEGALRQFGCEVKKVDFGGYEVGCIAAAYSLPWKLARSLVPVGATRFMPTSFRERLI